MEELIRHNIILQSDNITLRPMTEGDWNTLLIWNTDPDVLYFTEGDNVENYSLEEIKYIYRYVSQKAFCFIIEYNSEPIGECWLQEMNIYRILNKFPRLDNRRIDIMIGVKSLWNKGLGAKAIELLSKFGFEMQNADNIFACGVADYNPRAINTFKKLGFELLEIIEQPEDSKANFYYDLILSREKYESSSQT